MAEAKQNSTALTTRKHLPRRWDPFSMFTELELDIDRLIGRRQPSLLPSRRTTGAIGASWGIDQLEVREGEDDRERHHDREDRQQQRERDEAEALPAARAVDQRRLIERRRDGLRPASSEIATNGMPRQTFAAISDQRAGQAEPRKSIYLSRSPSTSTNT